MLVFTTFSTHEIHVEQRRPDGENGRDMYIFMPNF